jgi:hypothetical protein
MSYNNPGKFMLDIQRDQLLMDTKKLQGIIRVNLGQDTALMQQITQIKASVVPGDRC